MYGVYARVCRSVHVCDYSIGNIFNGVSGTVSYEWEVVFIEDFDCVSGSACFQAN